MVISGNVHVLCRLCKNKSVDNDGIAIVIVVTHIGDGEEQFTRVMGRTTYHVWTMYGPTAVHQRHRTSRCMDDQTRGKTDNVYVLYIKG